MLVFQDEHDFALALARRGAALAMSHLPLNREQVQKKPDGTEVTLVETQVEEYIRSELLRRYPDDSISGEELGKVKGSSSRGWIIDPIDGTAAFVRGVPTFSTLIALADEFGPQVGVMVAPALRREMSAVRGTGNCMVDGRPTKVSRHRSLRDATMSTSGFHLWLPPELALLSDLGVSIFGWGDAFGFMLLVTGQVDAIWEPGAKEWDIPSVRVMVVEAGGLVSPGPRGRGWVASNGLIHDELLQVLETANQ